MSITDHIPGDIKRVSRSIGYALWLNSANRWLGLPKVLRARLDPYQRAALAFIAIKSLDREDGILTVEKALGTGAGRPDAPLFGFMDQAIFWADMAEQEELEAYCVASFKRMYPARQRDFLEYVQGMDVA